MKKTKKDPLRKEDIQNESIVDAWGQEERPWADITTWRTKSQARCTVTRAVSPLAKVKPVEVQCMAPEDGCSADMLVLIRWQSRTVVVRLAQLAGVNVDESTAEAIADWHYWIAQGYCF